MFRGKLESSFGRLPVKLGFPVKVLHTTDVIHLNKRYFNLFGILSELEFVPVNGISWIISDIHSQIQTHMKLNKMMTCKVCLQGDQMAEVVDFRR